MGRYRIFFNRISKLSRQSDRNIVVLLLSFGICRIFHGASWDNFCVLEMYKYTNAERCRMYTFRRQKKISDTLNSKASEKEMHTLMDKNQFNLTFKNYIKRDWYDATNPDKEKLSEFLAHNEKFLLKPILSSCGNGIRVLRSSNLNMDKFFDEISGQKVILEGFINQNQEISRINPSSVNTVRLISARCGSRVHIVGGGIRCGGKNAFVDNFHNGGCAYPIDIETGIVSAPGRALGSQKRIIKHPSTDVIMCGFQIPNWNKIIDTVYAAAKVMENVGYIGWDIAVLEDGCEIIEANVNYPDPDLVQLDGFAAYEGLLRFMKDKP